MNEHDDSVPEQQSEGSGASGAEPASSVVRAVEDGRCHVCQQPMPSAATHCGHCNSAVMPDDGASPAQQPESNDIGTPVSLR